MRWLGEWAKAFFFIVIVLRFAPPLLQGLKEQYTELFEAHTRIGVLTIDTPINDTAPYLTCLEHFFKDPSIKAILVRIDSPGGITGSCQALFDEIQTLKKQYCKPIIAITENLCTSGAYYVACATDHIIATRSAIVGGIGATLTTLFNYRELANRLSIKPQVISAGSYKNATNSFVDPTPEQLAMLQSITDDSYQQFAGDVAQARKLSLNERDLWAQGRLFTGQQALALHLIDQTGSLSQAAEKIESLVLTEGPLLWVNAETQPTFFERIIGTSGTYLQELTNIGVQAVHQTGLFG